MRIRARRPRRGPTGRRRARGARTRGRATSAARAGGPVAGAATTAQKRGPWPNTRRWASSWTTTVSSASGGARMSRQLNDRRPVREALPQRVRWSRIETAVGLTPRAAPCVGERGLDHRPGQVRGSSRAATSAAGRGSRAARRTMSWAAAGVAEHRGAASPRPGRDEHEDVLPAVERDPRSGRDGSELGDPRPALGLLGEVAPDPGLALGDERRRQAPALARPEPPAARDRDDRAAGRVDHDPDPMGARRPAQRVRQAPRRRDARGPAPRV